jgi:hypothetical protein
MSVNALLEIFKAKRDKWEAQMLGGSRSTCSQERVAMESAQIAWLTAHTKDVLQRGEVEREKKEAFKCLLESEPCVERDVQQWLSSTPLHCDTGVGGDDQRRCSRKRAKLG